MVAVFGVFATLSAVEFKQMGVGLSAAILIDANDRARGSAASGEWNWYLPRWLERLSRASHEPAAETNAAPEVEREMEPAGASR
jgi:uncharacterized membrane protein YdfJ with MMPL/SSD domain